MPSLMVHRAKRKARRKGYAMSEIAKMKDIIVNVTCPKKSATWALKVPCKVPTTVAGWVKEMGEDAVQQALERFWVIRAGDKGRQLKAGTDKRPSQPDSVIELAVRNFKFGVKTSFMAIPTKESAMSGLRALSAEERRKAAMELLAELDAEIASEETPPEGDYADATEE
jgi:hypothetical protein